MIQVHNRWMVLLGLHDYSSADLTGALPLVTVADDKTGHGAVRVFELPNEDDPLAEQWMPGLGKSAHIAALYRQPLPVAVPGFNEAVLVGVASTAPSDTSFILEHCKSHIGSHSLPDVQVADIEPDLNPSGPLTKLTGATLHSYCISSPTGTRVERLAVPQDIQVLSGIAGGATLSAVSMTLTLNDGGYAIVNLFDDGQYYVAGSSRYQLAEVAFALSQLWRVQNLGYA